MCQYHCCLLSHHWFRAPWDLIGPLMNQTEDDWSSDPLPVSCGHMWTQVTANKDTVHGDRGTFIVCNVVQVVRVIILFWRAEILKKGFIIFHFQITSNETIFGPIYEEVHELNEIKFCKIHTPVTYVQRLCRMCIWMCVYMFNCVWGLWCF
jgi:hypothetical protein